MAAIRCEAEADFAEIHRLVKEAFATAEVSDGEEQNFVKILRSGSRYLPEFALVAQEKEMLVGHIMLTKLRFLGPEGEAKGKNIGIIIGMILAFRQNQLTDSDIAMQLMQRFSLSEDEILDYMRAADETDARGDIY